MTNNRTTALLDAAKAVVDRWDSPNWGGRNLEHTADYINRLREALAAFDQPDHIEQPLEMVGKEAVSEMTALLCAGHATFIQQAEALAKLGTIRVVDK